MRFNQAQTHRLHHHRKGKRIRTKTFHSLYHAFHGKALFMKKTKRNWKELLSEALLEIVLSLIFLLIGAGVVAIFGVDFSKIDSDLLILIGVVAFFLFFGGALAYFEKRKKRKRRSRNKEEGDTQKLDTANHS